MTVDLPDFKNTLAQWSSGVTVVTTVWEAVWYGITVSSFTSVSLEPPLVSICVAKKLFTHSVIGRSGVFAVNILAQDQMEWGRRFAGLYPEIKDRFADINCLTTATGCPVFADGLGWLGCRVDKAYAGGDHTIFVGEVVGNGHRETPGMPLVYHDRQWGRFIPLDHTNPPE